MKNLKIILIILLTLNLSAHAAKTILVSDIDDTVKVAHVRNKIAAVKNAYRVTNIFLGMADLYKIIERRLDADIYYLTNAPAEVMKWSHSTLLYAGDFPQQENLLIRPIKVSTKVFKAQKLRELIEREKPDQVILVGDNGEHDHTFYHDVSEEYPGIKFYIFIRAAYNFNADNKLYSGQKSFITPFEIADSLYQSRLLHKSDSERLLDLHLQDYLDEKDLEDEGMMYTPEWQSCYGHRLSFWAMIRSTLPSKLTKKIKKLCLMPTN